MSFAFPDAPVIGDTHTEFGVDYVYDGNGVWNLAGGGDLVDYVLKAGDTITGPLVAQIGAPGGIRVIASDPAHGHVHLSGGAADRTGMVEFMMGDQRKARFGWGTPTEIEFAFENGSTGLRMIGGGIHIGSDSAQTDPLNLSRGVCLYGYGATSQFGLSITSGTLNYVVQNAGNKHNFIVGTENVMDVRSDGVRIPGGNLNVTGTITASGEVRGQDIFATRNLHATGNLDVDGTSDFVGAARIPLTTNKMIQNPVTAGGNGYFIGDSWHGMCFDGATKLQFVEYHGIFEFVKRTTGTTGGLVQASFNNGNLTCNIATIGGALNVNGGAIVPESEHIQIGQSGERNIGGGDGNGGIVHRVKQADNHKFFCGTANPFNIDQVAAYSNGFVAKSTEALDVARDLELYEEDGLDLVKALALCLGKIKLLEAELAELR